MGRRMARLRARELAEPRQRPRIHPAQLHAVRRRRHLPARRYRAHEGHVEDAAAAARQGTREGHPRRVAGPLQHPRARPRLHRQGATRSSSACRPTRRSSARSCRSAAGAWSRASLEAYGYKPDERVGEIFTKYRKTHNDGVFDAYTPDIRKAARRRASSPACRMPTAAAASSATTAGSRSTASTSSSPTRSARRRSWTTATRPRT